MHALAPRLRNGGRDLLDFLPAEQTVFARVGIEAGDRDARLGQSETAAGTVRKAYDLQHARPGAQIAGNPERHMRGDVNDAHGPVHQHHGVILRAGERRIDLRVTAVMEPREIQSFLVERSGDGRVDFARHGEPNHLFNRHVGGAPSLCLHFAKRKGAQVHQVLI